MLKCRLNLAYPTVSLIQYKQKNVAPLCTWHFKIIFLTSPLNSVVTPKCLLTSDKCRITENSAVQLSAPSSSIGFTWELNRNAEFWILPWTYWIRICIFSILTRSQGLACAHYSLRSIDVKVYIQEIIYWASSIENISFFNKDITAVHNEWTVCWMNELVKFCLFFVFVVNPSFMFFVSFQGFNAMDGWKRLPTGRHHWPVVPTSLWLVMQNMNWLVLSKPLLKTSHFYSTYKLFQLTQIPVKY